MIGAILGVRYELQTETDDSALWVTYRGIDKSTGHEVRIRVLKDPFREEPSFLKAMSQHIDFVRGIQSPGLERIHGFMQEDKMAYLATESNSEVSLEERLRRLSSFSTQLAINVAMGICQGLEALHREGVSHGDVSARNVFLDPQGRAILALSGIWETLAHSQRAGLASLPGMAPYLAPEITLGVMPSPSSDIYALGALLFEMLTGRPPYRAETTSAYATKHATAPYPSLRFANAAVPGPLDEIVRKCLAKSPAERYASVGELSQDLTLLYDALRFGRPLTWPLRDDASVRQITPELNVVEQKSRKKPQNQAQASVRRQNSDGLPLWLSTLFYLSTILVVLTIGAFAFFNLQAPRLVNLPNVIGLSSAEAQQRLGKLGLQMRVSRRAMSDKFPAGAIIDQQPPAGSDKIRERSFVEVVLSSGGRFVVVPDLRGRSVEEARSLVENLGLELSEDTARVQDENIKEGLIVSQEPQPKKKLERDGSVRVSLSNGNRPTGGNVYSRFNYALKITMPPGSVPIVVRVDMTDQRETQTIHEEEHIPDEEFEVTAEAAGDEAIFRIFFDGKLVDTQKKKADPAAQAEELE